MFKVYNYIYILFYVSDCICIFFTIFRHVSVHLVSHVKNELKY